MKKTILSITLVLLAFSLTAQSKKEQIEVLNFSLDSLKNILSHTYSAFGDSLRNERYQITKQKIVIDKQLSELEQQGIKSKSLQDELKASSIESASLKKELETIKRSQQLIPPVDGNYKYEDENYWIEVNISKSETEKYIFDIYIQNNPKNGGNAFDYQDAFEKIYLKEDSTICEYWISDECLLQIIIHEDKCLVSLSDPFYIYPVKLEDCILKKIR